MKNSKIKLALIITGCLLLPIGSFVVYKLDKWEIMPVRFWRASYDRATPKGALFFMRRALLTGDANGYVASFQFTEQDEALRQSLRQMVLAFARLRRQLAQTYGDVDADMAVRSIAPAVVPEAMIHLANVDAKGDRTMISLGSKESKLVDMELIRSGGVWRLLPESAFGGMSRQQISFVMLQFAAVIDKTIPEIAKGKYPDAYGAQLAIKHEMN